MLLGCIAASVVQSAAYTDDSTDTEDPIVDVVGFFEQPAIRNICRERGAEFPGCHGGAGDAPIDAAIDLSSVRCPICTADFIHIKCAPADLSQIKCCSCDRVIYCKAAELDMLIEQIRRGSIGPEGSGSVHRILDGLKSAGHNLMFIILRSYDMTVDELSSLKSIVGMAGASYRGVMHAIDQNIRVKAIYRMQASAIAASLANTQALATALPILDTVITPNFIAMASKKQIVTLIKMLVEYKGTNVDACGTLMKKIVDLTNIVSMVQFSDADISELLGDFICSGQCAMIKYLVGRYRFSHRLTDANICAIVKQYVLMCAYSDETFVPLLIILINGNISDFSLKHRIQKLIDALPQQDTNSTASQVYEKLWRVAEKCNSESASTEEAIADYARMLGNEEFSLNEDLFCAIIRIRESKRCEFAPLIERVRGVRGAHIIRHIPFCWLRRNSTTYFAIAEQAIEQKELAVLEEVLTVLVNMKQSSENMRRFFCTLLESNCRDYAGLALRIISHSKLRRFRSNGLTDDLFKQLGVRGMHWCLPYLKGHVGDRAQYRQAIGQHCEEIMEVAVMGKFQFLSPFREIIRCDSENSFFVKNLRDYLEALLKTPTERCTIQRILVEVCSKHAFRNMLGKGTIPSIYELFKKQRDCFFYYDAFYYALQHSHQRDRFKALLMNDLEKSVATGGLEAVFGARIDALRQKIHIIQHGSHMGRDAQSDQHEAAHDAVLGELLAMLRYARANK